MVFVGGAKVFAGTSNDSVLAVESVLVSAFGTAGHGVAAMRFVSGAVDVGWNSTCCGRLFINSSLFWERPSSIVSR
jgi:hypothetical protein